LRFDAACLPVFAHYTRIKVRLATSGVVMARDEGSREDGGFYEVPARCRSILRKNAFRDSTSGPSNRSALIARV